MLVLVNKDVEGLFRVNKEASIKWALSFGWWFQNMFLDFSFFSRIKKQRPNWTDWESVWYDGSRVNMSACVVDTVKFKDDERHVIHKDSSSHPRLSAGLHYASTACHLLMKLCRNVKLCSFHETTLESLFWRLFTLISVRWRDWRLLLWTVSTSVSVFFREFW